MSDSNQTSEAPPAPNAAQQAQAEAEARARADQLREQRTRGQRSLFIYVLLMFLVSIVVFVVGTYFFVVPQIIRQNLDIRQLTQNVARLDHRLDKLEQPEDLTPAAAPAPSLPAPADEPPAAESAQPKAAPAGQPAAEPPAGK